MESSFEAITPVCRDVEELLKKHGFQKDTFIADILIREMFSNAVRHGNKFNPDKKVICSFTITKTIIDIEMIDEGDGFNWRNIPVSEQNCLSESGRGITIYHMYSDKVEFNEKGNRVLIRKDLGILNRIPRDVYSFNNLVRWIHEREKVVVCFQTDLCGLYCDQIIITISNLLKRCQSIEIVIMDMKYVSTIDTKGISVLFYLVHKLSDQGIRTTAVNISALLKNLFRSVELDCYIDVE